jgi:hypothetical protein
VFEALTEEGSRIPPRKLDGKMHYDGDIVVAEKAAMIRMLRICRPAFNATENIPTVLVGPLPRYVSAACCADPEHMANRCTPGFMSKMRAELETVNKTIKDFLHNDGYTNIRALDPWVCVRQLDVSQIWGTDPVHIRKEHVTNLIEGVKIALSKLAPKRRRDSAETTPGPPSKRGKTAAASSGGGIRVATGGRGARGGTNGGSNNVGGNGVVGTPQGGGGPNGGGGAAVGGRGGSGGNRGRGPQGGQAGGGSAPSGNGYGRGGNSGRGGRYGGGGGRRVWRGGRYGRMA